MKALRTTTLSALGLACTLMWAPLAHAALIDITQPGDAISLVNGVNDGDGNAGSPTRE